MPITFDDNLLHEAKQLMEQVDTTSWTYNKLDEYIEEYTELYASHSCSESEQEKDILSKKFNLVTASIQVLLNILPKPGKSYFDAIVEASKKQT